ncbi:PelD GGDEF domain-containing protein [Pseudomonas schmalbachii]|uniref:Sugar transporter n=1 Tax=Pseudomonas schmalbachii TaxID=2816993 RepID=A0ABS3TSA9_9PSED|nr:PelD GGDEF domain-containing protein [Pseudomonas schmalbachii]MBO3276566.1 sugar transporter [Pseudomonas schmalbachii]
MQSVYRHYILTPSAGGVAWLETLVFTFLAVALGWWYTPEDPLLVKAPFPWVILAPLLISMRYGFVRGLSSAALLVATLLVLRASGLSTYAQLPASFIVGVLLCAMLVGEFRDLWGRRLERLDLANNYRQLRLDEFTRAHHVLRISHDRLEQRIAGNDQSLRSSLLGLRQKLRSLPHEDDALASLAESVLSLLAPYGSLRIAGLYRVHDNRRVDPRALASIGDMGPLDVEDLLVGLCLERGELVSIRQELLDQDEQHRHSRLQVCIPLVDTEGGILAILAVQQMPFFMFHERNFSLLAILAGHIADMLMSDPQALQLEDTDAQRFSQYLKRSLLDAREHDLPACLFAFELTDAQHGGELQRLLESSQRGLDVQIRVRNERGNRVVLVLLPLTSEDSAQGYLRRLHDLFAERFGKSRSMEDLGVRTWQYDLAGGGEREALRNFLFNGCGLNDQQVAI